MATQAIWTHGPRPQPRYTTVAIILHWAIAAFILFNLASGFFRGALPRGTMAIHISSGITILLLSVVRVAWRLTHRPPPHPEGLKPWEKGLSHTVHFLLYVAMIAMPLTGWAIVSASPPPGSPGAAAAAAEKAAEAPPGAKPAPPRKPTMLWWVLPLPKIGPLQEMGRYPDGLAAQEAKHDQVEMLHGYGGWILLALFCLHVAGALKHQFVDRQRELARMGIGRAED